MPYHKAFAGRIGQIRLRRARSALTVLVGYLMRLQDRRRQRRALARLDPWLLRDIGLTLGNVHDEIERLSWRRPMGLGHRLPASQARQRDGDENGRHDEATT